MYSTQPTFRHLGFDATLTTWPPPSLFDIYIFKLHKSHYALPQLLNGKSLSFKRHVIYMQVNETVLSSHLEFYSQFWQIVEGYFSGYPDLQTVIVSILMSEIFLIGRRETPLQIATVLSTRFFINPIYKYCLGIIHRIMKGGRSRG